MNSVSVCHTKLTPLLWNEFPITHSFTDVICEIEVQIRTKRLSLNLVSEDTLKRHKVIDELHKKGLSDKEIADVLNASNIKTPTGLNYYQELVFVTRRKMRLREKRTEDLELTLGKVNFFLADKTSDKDDL